MNIHELTNYHIRISPTKTRSLPKKILAQDVRRLAASLQLARWQIQIMQGKQTEKPKSPNGSHRIFV